MDSNRSLLYLLPQECVIVVSTLVGICLFMTIPAIARCRQMHRHRYTPYIKHRGIHLSLLCVGALVFFVQIATPLFVIADSHLWGASLPALLLCRVIASTSLYTFLTLFLCRSWHIHFTIHRNSFAENMKWTQYIVEKDSLSTNWYIQREHTWGNPNFLVKRALAVGMLIGLGQTIAYYGGVNIFSVTFETITHLILFGWFLYLSWRTPSLDDMWGIRSEISFVTKTISLEVFLIGVLVGVAYIFCLSFAIVFIFMIVFGLLWIPATWKMTSYSLESECSVREDAESMFRDCLHTCCGVRYDDTFGLEIPEQLTPSSNIMTAVLETMADSALFFEFANHLCSEFAVESILYLVEVTQFQIHLRDTYPEVVESDDAKSILNLAGFGTNDRQQTPTCNVFEIDWKEHELPLSAIVHSDMSDMDKAKAIYEKYIKFDAPFEINLSYPCRKELSDVLCESENDLSKTDLLRVFHLATVEILHLLRDSQTRFQSRRLEVVQSQIPERARES